MTPLVSPREGGSGGGLLDAVKTIALFAVFAVPVGILIERSRSRKQVNAEKAEFSRLGLDWGTRSRH